MSGRNPATNRTGPSCRRASAVRRCCARSTRRGRKCAAVRRPFLDFLAGMSTRARSREGVSDPHRKTATDKRLRILIPVSFLLRGRPIIAWISGLPRRCRTRCNEWWDRRIRNHVFRAVSRPLSGREGSGKACFSRLDGEAGDPGRRRRVEAGTGRRAVQQSKTRLMRNLRMASRLSGGALTGGRHTSGVSWKGGASVETRGGARTASRGTSRRTPESCLTVFFGVG